MATAPSSAAPWRTRFETHLNKNSSSEFLLSTIGHDAQNRPVPRSRVCGFRGFFPTPDLHSSAAETLEKQAGGGNPGVYESDMITFTTDVRMEKVGQLSASGNVVEGVFWLKDVGSQWRVKGVAFVIGDAGGGEGEDEARREIQRGLRVKDGEEGRVGDWGWEKQVTTYFANHTPVLRGSFKSPPPGQPRSQVPADPNVKLGQKVDDIFDPIARKNFRVVVIRPEEVEQLDVSDYENPQRWNWTWDEKKGQWEEVELWP
ncbi:hypothetical protein ASPWEDRAFT_26548 [Aspergillus wentii DTO 134E9]|uniref:Pyridoxamine 5'-phosphate oxidase Alr4036 family FMN-binding domain-containing protein n=1 Tax=Aspergillus wentii DTO 134E9 TaxID=1073089 RepID=A0A1L9RQP9_ASPWE|nr:uncharacterized protein ASPWEDRAFT_26548 [Aspergillus wentii DTO 134E9]KAI9928376.1 hypothetical protein MW887_002414 [Aspergillus wentii]OJJ37137.1 hypothetical protein ASPWEDRAFT_26548 [Aspergillus wentii DTO 134E9]